MEGFLPTPWWELWLLLSLPFLALGLRRLKEISREGRESLPLLGVAGAFIFVLSALKLPSVTGSCSHPTGTGLSAIFFGPFITPVLSLVVLLYQALLLAHGGITTLGANVFSMGIAGPLVGYGVYRAGERAGVNTYLTVFVAAALADLSTYLVTSLQLALAFPAAEGGIIGSFIIFAGIFALTQLPLAIVEGILAALVFKYVIAVRADLLVRLNVLEERRAEVLRGALQ